MTPLVLRMAGFAAGSAIALAPLAVAAQQLTYATGWPPGGSVPDAIDEIVEYMAENSDIEPKHYPMSLLSFNEAVAGLRDGVADISYVLTPYFPAEFSETNLAADLTMLATSGTETTAPGLAMSAALAEYVVLHCPECQEEFRQQNQIYIGGGSTPDYSLLCDRPITSAEDLQGVRIRTGAANFGRWAERFGAVKVAISGAEIYEAMSQNAVDCAAAAVPELINLRLIEVVSDVTPGVPGGVFAGVGSMNVNLDIWSGLSPEQREFLLRAGARLMATIGIEYIRAAGEAEAEARAAGIKFHEPSQELIDASAEFTQSDVETIGQQFTETYGVENVDAKIEEISALIEKWKGLVEPVADDRDAFADLLWEQIYSKVDPATYGLQ